MFSLCCIDYPGPRKGDNNVYDYGNFQIMICPDVHNLAAVIRRISEDTMKSQTHRTMEEWLDRSWLTLDVTQV